jgi:hypothetical protein
MRNKRAIDWPEWIKAVGIVISPIAAIWIGNSFSESMKDRETQTRYVEVAISILREAPKPETQNLREWAVATVNAYAKIPLAGDARKELFEHQLSGISSGKSAPTGCQKLPDKVESFIKIYSSNIGEESCEYRKVVRGDINSDGVEDLVVTISITPCARAENRGPLFCGNTTYEHMVGFLGKEFHVVPAGQVGGKGERYITGLEIVKNIIKAKTEYYAPDDPLCCPSKKGKTEFIVKDGALVEKQR